MRSGKGGDGVEEVEVRRGIDGFVDRDAKVVTRSEVELDGGGDVSGKGYSKRTEVVAKGVPTIWEEGEWRVMSERSRVGIELGWVVVERSSWDC